MLIRVLPEKVAEANKWFHDVLNPEGEDNFTLPLIDEATGTIAAYWASINFTPEQETLVNERFFDHDSEEATKDMGTTLATVTAKPVAIGEVVEEPLDPVEVPVRLGLKFADMKPEQVLTQLNARCATEADVIDTKPIEITKEIER